MLFEGRNQNGADMKVALQIILHLFLLTRTSRNQKGKVAQGMACQRQEKRDKRKAFPAATFPVHIVAECV